MTSLLLISCGSVMIKHEYNSTASINKKEYSEQSSKKGVVLLAVNWNRKWNCGSFENAEIRSIGFDLLPKRYNDDKHTPDFILNGSSFDNRGFINYAFLLEPGKYAISYTDVKVAKSMSDVGHFTAHRSNLFKSGKPKGGTFTINKGEVVYVGHFALDCAGKPMVWRYYTEDKDGFNKYVNKYVNKYKSYYPYINLNNVQFRLFKTNLFGNDFSL